MRLFVKIFFCATLVLSAAVLFSGYLLITASYENAMTRETEHAYSSYQYDKFAVQSALLSTGDFWEESALEEIGGTLSGKVAFFSESKTLLYTNLPDKAALSLPESCTEETVSHYFLGEGEKTYLAVCSKLSQEGRSLYLLTATDISVVIESRRQMTADFGKVYFITLGISAVMILLFTALLVRPIKRLTKAADRMANGQYDERIAASGSDEIALLSVSFNHMAAAVEDQMEQLAQNARQKEDFVANFAHELKTPLTSVIGYADMLYQKPLSSEAVRDAAGYILQEGLRLEALSLKLMDLIVLNRQDFVLEELSAVELLENAAMGVQALVHAHGITLHTDFAPADVLAEFDLLKTLLLNLLDNGVKAEPREIWLTGRVTGERYEISVRDNGRGIPQQELTRITEAFYMVDKARTRTQHGAGLGLALAQRIAELHGDSLHFQSEVGAGTTVRFTLSCKRGDVDD